MAPGPDLSNIQPPYWSSELLTAVIFTCGLFPQSPMSTVSLCVAMIVLCHEPDQSVEDSECNAVQAQEIVPKVH